MAYRWAMAEQAAGRRVTPGECDACGQTEGLIERHSEDYSAPFGDHIGRHGLCYTCHMMVHCRVRSPEAWRPYRDAVRAGAVFKPFHGRAFNAFAAAFLRGTLPAPARWRAGRADTLLDQIDRGELLPPGLLAARDAP
jgi:hypothetical protein